MPSLKSLRSRVKTVKNTRKITRAMKLVAAAKLRKAQDAVVAARPYSALMRDVIASITVTAEPEEHPLFRTADTERKILIVPVTSDRGLCGGFNSSILRKVDNFIRTSKDSYEEIGLGVVGRKGRDYYKNADVPSYLDMATLAPDASLAAAQATAKEVIERFKAEEVDAVYLVYNEFVSALTQEVVFEKLLPLSADAFEETRASEDFTPTEYTFEPDQEKLLNLLLPKYIESQVFRALLESQASEQGARMTAMDNATNNAGDLIDKLTLQMNRARQAAITTELMEITSGAEALKG